MKIARSWCLVIINVMNEGGATNNGPVFQHPIGFKVGPILYVKQVSREICKDPPIDLLDGLALFGKTYFSKLDHMSRLNLSQTGVNYKTTMNRRNSPRMTCRALSKRLRK